MICNYLPGAGLGQMSEGYSEVLEIGTEGTLLAVKVVISIFYYVHFELLL